MKTGAVMYNGTFLMPGSTVYELYHNVKDTMHLKKLNDHMTQLEKNFKELLKKAEKFEDDERRKRT